MPVVLLLGLGIGVGLLALAGGLLLGPPRTPAALPTIPQVGGNLPGVLPSLVATLTGGGSGGAVRLGEFFTLAEFTASATASAQGIDNTPTETHLANLRALVNATLDPIRRDLGQPITVTSGYRSEALNAALDGAEGSFHARGSAADIKTAGMSNQQLARFIVDSGHPFTELIWYGHTGHVHIAYVVGRGEEREVLYQAAKGGPYVEATP